MKILVNPRYEHLRPFVERLAHPIFFARNGVTLHDGRNVVKLFETDGVRLVAQGAVAMFAALGAQGAEQRRAVLEAVGALTQGAAADYVREELAWRLA